MIPAANSLISADLLQHSKKHPGMRPVPLFIAERKLMRHFVKRKLTLFSRHFGIRRYDDSGRRSVHN
jgi:hypothetical protein